MVLTQYHEHSYEQLKKECFSCTFLHRFSRVFPSGCNYIKLTHTHKILHVSHKHNNYFIYDDIYIRAKCFDLVGYPQALQDHRSKR